MYFIELSAGSQQGLSVEMVYWWHSDNTCTPWQYVSWALWGILQELSVLSLISLWIKTQGSKTAAPDVKLHMITVW